jgi:acetylornithine deacetylase
VIAPDDAELLALHRDLVATASVSHAEGPICDRLFGWLRARGVEVERLGDNLVAEVGPAGGPRLCFNTHLDTVPPAAGWTRPPFEPQVEQGRVYGLGSNDAKASAAAMVAAFLRAGESGRLRARLMLTLVCEEETGGKGTELVLPELSRQGRLPEAAVVGEPTDLEIAVAQKGLLVLELRAEGRACHAAHARALGAPNALRLLAQDLVRLDAVDLGPEHPLLGPVTLEPTVASGGSARNAVPALATCVLDGRVNPDPGPAELVARLRAAVRGELRVLSDRLAPCQVDPAHPVVRAAQRARPASPLVGSRGLSDQAFFARAGVPAIKVGPGRTERSHTADEFVLETEILEGARFYEALALGYRTEEGNEK